MRSLPAFFALLALAVGATGIARAEPLLIRNSYVVPVSNWAPLIVVKKDLAKHWGKSYNMEAVRYQGTPQMITALANGELEFVNLAYSTLGIAISNAGISDLRVISDEFRDGVPGYFSNQFFVRKDSGIKKIEDLKGKVLATNLIGTGVDIAMKAGLKKHGLLDKRDYTVIETPFPTMPAMLERKKSRPGHGGHAVRAQSDAQPDRHSALRSDRGPRYFAVRVLDGTAILHRRASRRADRLHGGHAADRALVSRPVRTMPRSQRSPRTCSRSRRSDLTGCSPRRTIIAIRT